VTDGQTDRQMDRQTELPWHIRAIAYLLSRVKSVKFYWPMAYGDPRCLTVSNFLRMGQSTADI